MIDFTSDTHIHTNYSPDASKEATFQKYIKEAQNKGLKKIVFTDHVDFDAAHPLFETPINYDEYIREFRKLDTGDLTVLLGVEIGYQSHETQNIQNFLKKYPFEHIILSVHYIEKKDLYTQEYFLGKTKKEAYKTYFLTLLKAVKEINDFTVVGHFDYITRYSPFGDYDYEEYKEIIDQILIELVTKNKGIEINTSGIDYEKRVYPKNEIIKRYIELGGKTITIGSDSHKIEELGRHFEYLKKSIYQKQ